MELDYHTVVERFHTFQNPSSEAKFDLLIDYCDVSDGQKILDIGCGKAWLLRRIAQQFSIQGVGVELRAALLQEAMDEISKQTLRGELTLHHMPAKEYKIDPGSFDIGLCIGASFAIGSFEEMLAHLKPAVRPGGILAMGDIYARTDEMPEQSATHFAGGKQRTLADTAEMLNQDGLTLIGIIDSSDDDWDRYESLHWYAADRWLRENPQHPERDEFYQLNERWKHNHINYDRPSLGWGLFICRVENE